VLKPAMLRVVIGLPRAHTEEPLPPPLETSRPRRRESSRGLGKVEMVSIEGIRKKQKQKQKQKSSSATRVYSAHSKGRCE
jgi:hypothetical protein